MELRNFIGVQTSEGRVNLAVSKENEKWVNYRDFATTIDETSQPLMVILYLSSISY